AWEAPFAFTPGSAPGVFVSEPDVDKSIELLEVFFNQEKVPKPEGKWACGNCGELIDEQFDACWNCEAPRGNAAIEINDVQLPSHDEPDSPKEIAEPSPETIAPAATQPGTWNLWVEVILVLALITPLYGGRSALGA